MPHMAHIDDVPAGVAGAGQDFDYTDPPTLADVVLVNAPLDPSHTNVGLNRAAYDAFIQAEIDAGRAWNSADHGQVNLLDPEHDLILPIPFEDALTFYNYGRVTINGRPWYIFYTPIFLNKESTRFRADIDEFPSFSWSLGYSLVKRGHIAVAASQGDTYGDQYLTAPEPIDAPPVNGLLGSDIGGSTPSGWTVLVISANDLRGTGGGTPFWAQHVNAAQIANAADLASSATIDSSATVQVPISNAEYPWTNGSIGDGPDVMVPVVQPSPGSTIDGVAAGGGVYLFTIAGFAEYVTIMQGAPWVLSGIVDVRLVPSWAVSGGGSHAFTPRTPSQDPSDSSWETAAGIPVFVGAVTTGTESGTALASWRETVLSDLDATIWRKLITSQFCEILIGNGDGFRQYRPDQWHASGVGYELVTGASHGDPSIRLIPTGYNELGEHEGVDVSTGGSAGRFRSGFGQAASNPASQDMGPWLSAYSSQNQWVGNLRNKELAVALGITRVQFQAGIQGIQTVLGGAIGAAGGLGGSPLAAAGGAAAALPNLATAAINASNSITLLDVSEDGAFDIGALLLGLSGIASVNSFNSWFQSLSSASGDGTPDSLGSAWRAIVGQAFKVVISVPSAERVKALLSEWRRFGYMIGQAFTPPRLDAMSRFTYWETEGSTIVGAVPQEKRQTIAQAFDGGVTVWTSIAEIGTDVTASNTPNAGISY